MGLNNKVKSALTACAVVTLIVCAASARGAGDSATGLTAGYHFTSSKDLPLRPIDLSPFPGKYSTEILASPSTGLQAEIVMYTRLAAGAGKRGLYTLPADHTYLVMKGRLNLQLGSDEFVLEPNSLALVLMPAQPGGGPRGIAPIRLSDKLAGQGKK